MYNRNQNIISHILQTPVEPKSRNVLWDDGTNIKIWRKSGWTSIGSNGSGLEDGEVVSIGGFPLEISNIKYNHTLLFQDSKWVNARLSLKELYDVDFVDDEISDGALFTYNSDEGSWRATSRHSFIDEFIEKVGWKLEDGKVVTVYPVKINNSLIVEGDTSSGGEGQDTPSGGGDIDFEVLEGYLKDYYKIVDADAKFQNKISTSNKLPYSYLSETPTIPNVPAWAQKDKLDANDIPDLSNVYLPLEGTAKKATQLENSVTLWGQSFNGTKNISGALSGVSSLTGSTISGNKILFSANSNNAYTLSLGPDSLSPSESSDEFYFGSEDRRWHVLFAKYGNFSEDVEVSGSINAQDATLLNGLTISSGGASIKGDVTIDGNLIVKGDTSSGGTGQDTPSGGVTEEDVEQYLTNYVNDITTTGSGNVISSVSKSGKIITFNKGIAAITSQGGTITGELKVNNTATVNSLKVWDGGSNVATLLMDRSSLSINKELKLTNGGYVDISSGVAAAFKTNYAQIKSLIANDIYIGAANSGTTSNLAFNIKTYKGISSQAPANAATVFSVDVNGNVTANGSLSADLNWNDILYNKPTTLAGYGITDAYILSGTITLGSKSIKPLTTHQTIHSLTIKNSLGTTLTTYTPNSAAQSITLGKAMVGLGSVENTALSTWSGTSNITTLGTITSGTWKGSAIANTYLANSSITIADTNVSLGGSIAASTITAAQIGSGNSFVHSGNIASQNVASAKKLATSVNIWGKSFDGSSDITGHLYLNNEAAINCKTTDGTNRKVLLINAANHLFVGPEMNGVGDTYITGNSMYFRYGAGRTVAMKINSSGNLGLGTSEPKYKLHVVGDSYINGNAIITGDTSSGSDIRFKDIIEHKTLKIEDIANAPCFSFKWNDRDDVSIHLGTSAQYWEKRVPELVSGKDFKTLNYASLGVAMCIALAKKNINHEDRIKVLEKENENLKEEIRRIHNGLC